MERQALNYYLAAAKRTKDADTRKLLGDLAARPRAAISAPPNPWSLNT